MMQALTSPFVPRVGECDHVGRLAQLVGEHLEALTPRVNGLPLLVAVGHLLAVHGLRELFERRRDVGHVRNDPVDDGLVHAQLQSADDLGQSLLCPRILEMTPRLNDIY